MLWSIFLVGSRWVDPDSFTDMAQRDPRLFGILIL